MAPRFLLDEQLRSVLWHAVQQRNAAGADTLDVQRVGDPPAPPLGSADPDILVWCEANRRVLVSADLSTMRDHLDAHFLAGRHTAGVLLLKPGWAVPSVLAELLLHDQALEPDEMIDASYYIV